MNKLNLLSIIILAGISSYTIYLIGLKILSKTASTLGFEVGFQ